MTTDPFFPDTATLSWVADRLDASAANTQIVRWLREAVKTEGLRPTPTPPADDVREAVEAERQRAAAHAREGYRGNETCDDITKRILSGEPAANEIPVRTWGPPTDGVREALAFHLFAEESTQEEEFTRRVWANHPAEHPVKRLYFDQADSIRAAFEVRPRGTVTQPADDLREALAMTKRTSERYRCLTKGCNPRCGVGDRPAAIVEAGPVLGGHHDNPALAKAWDEGFTLATRNNPNQPHPLAQSNPYRGEARS